MNDATRRLEPQGLWNHFANISALPRASKREEKVIEYVRAFGMRMGLDTETDAAGNTRIRKPASPGMEERPAVVLQAHLDMVHQKNAGTDFDFEREGIRCVVDGDWVRAEGTTLGADNGIGVSAILALLESSGIPHPPLEALFTIDEETGMTGAKALKSGWLEGRILLNLDSEEDNVLTVGCAGGIDTNTLWTYREELPAGETEAFRIEVQGLKGGHSGVDIHRGRANANKILTRLLYGTTAPYGLRIAEAEGGSLRNAIPREARATVVVPKARRDVFLEEFNRRASNIRLEFARIDPGMEISVTHAAMPARVMNPVDQDRVLGVLYAVPNAVYRMSPDIPGMVESSSSLARVILQNGEFRTQSLQRSNTASGREDVANAVRASFEVIGAEAASGNEYPGWAPNADSPLLHTMTALYQELFREAPVVEACHAGLECGIIGDHYPGMDMISFGPTIRHAHSPDECVSIGSVQKFWAYLLETLKAIR